MIAISIDEKACVGCEMCADTCPTEVYGVSKGTTLPEVVRPKECFGCLACCEVCPADAITHEGVVRSKHFYHDPYAVDMASKLTGEAPDDAHARPSEADIQAAQDDLGVRLQALSSVLHATVASGLAGVGTFAGRMLARQLPRYRTPSTFDEVLALARDDFAPAWELESEVDGDILSITVRGCFVRELCQKQGKETGGDLCTLFYQYLAGYLNGMGKARLRLIDKSLGADQCQYKAKVYA